MKKLILIVTIFQIILQSTFGQIKVASNGKVGIMNFAPTRGVLDIYDTPTLAHDGGITLYNPAFTYQSFRIYRKTNDIAYITRSGSDTKGIAINKDGKIGFGINPSSKFDIKYSGTLSARFNTSKAYMRVTDGYSSMLFDPNEIYTNGDFNIGCSNSTRFWYVTSSSGSELVRISNSTYKLYVYGKAYASSGWIGSDIRLKSNIQNIEAGSLNKIQLLRGTTYNLKSKGANSQERSYGFIAQELKEVFPELVCESDDSLKMLAINYDGLIPVLVEAIKEQQNQINELKSTIDELKTNPIVNKNVYPNPTELQANLDLTIPKNIKKAELRVFNSEGKLIKQIQIKDRGKSVISFDMSQLSAGIYTYTLVADGRSISSNKMLKK